MFESRLLARLSGTLLLITAACADTTTSPKLGASPSPVFSTSGNADAAHACQHDGFANLFRADGTGFANAGECVAYAAHGGTFAGGVRVRFSNIDLGGCNANTFGYEAGGVQHDLLSKPYGCFASTTADITVALPPGETARVYLRDNTCQWTFFEDGLHGLVTGTNPYLVKIGDGGGFCERPPALDIWNPANGGDPNGRGNLNVTKTIL